MANKVKKSIFGSRRAPKGLTIFGLVLGGFLMVFPFLWGLSVSLQGPGLAFKTPPDFFKPPYMFSNYVSIFEKLDFLAYFKNSAIVTALFVLGNIFSNSFVGFGFARYKFKGSGVLFFGLLATMMLPGNILIIPMYMIWNKVGALNTFIPLVLPSFFGSAFNIFLMRQCFMSLPGELYEAAIIDGAKPPMIFGRIYLPLAGPTIATIATMAFMSAWNDMFNPLIYITDKSLYTISLGLMYVQDAFKYNTELLMAAAMIAMAPTLVIYIFAQKYFVSGVSAGAVKG